MSGPLFRVPLLLLVLGSGNVLRAADDPAPPPGRPTREEIRESFKDLTPEERASRLKAFRENSGLGGPAGETLRKRRAELEKLRETLKDLPAEQRQVRIKEWRETNALSRPFATMSAEQRDAVRKDFQKRIEVQIGTLNKKKDDGSISEEETRRLQNMQRMLKRLESGPALASPRPPLGLPPPATPADKATKPSPATPAKPSDD